MILPILAVVLYGLCVMVSQYAKTAEYRKISTGEMEGVVYLCNYIRGFCEGVVGSIPGGVGYAVVGAVLVVTLVGLAP